MQATHNYIMLRLSGVPTLYYDDNRAGCEFEPELRVSLCAGGGPGGGAGTGVPHEPCERPRLWLYGGGTLE